MKRILSTGLMILIVFSAGSKATLAQSAENGVKNALSALFDYSRLKSYERASALIAYEGEDKTRNQKDSFKSADKDELNQVKRICKKIAALLDLSSKHEFGKFESEKVGAGDNFLIEVAFISGDQKLVTTFSFVKSDKGYLLININ